MMPLKGDKELKEGKRTKILTANKVLTKLLVLLAQVKAGNISYKLKRRNQTNSVFILLTQ